MWAVEEMPRGKQTEAQVKDMFWKSDLSSIWTRFADPAIEQETAAAGKEEIWEARTDAYPPNCAPTMTPVCRQGS